MKITTRDHVNARTSDGRVYSAGQGAVTLVDDDDTGMVELMRDLERRGLVDIEKPKKKAPAGEESTPPAGEHAPDGANPPDESKPATPRKSTRAGAAE